MERDDRKRNTRAKAREHKHGRGGTRTKPTKRFQQPAHFQDDEDYTEEAPGMALRMVTLDACTRKVRLEYKTKPSSEFSTEETEGLLAVLAQLSLKHQTTADFLVEPPSLEETIAVQTPTPASVAPVQAQKAGDLNSWLDGLLS